MLGLDVSRHSTPSKRLDIDRLPEFLTERAR